jgi:hypothetical protein
LTNKLSLTLNHIALFLSLWSIAPPGFSCCTSDSISVCPFVWCCCYFAQCNHFTTAFAAQLGLTNVPAWLNRGARMASAIGINPSGGNRGPVDLDGNPLRAEDAAALVLVQAQDVCLDALLDRSHLACLGAKPSQQLAAIIPIDGKGNRILLKPDAVLSSDADEQLLLFLPFTRTVRLQSMLIRLSVKDLAANPRTIKFFADQRNLDFSDVDSVPPTQTVQLPMQPAASASGAAPRAFTKEELKAGVYEVVIPLSAAKFHSTAMLTVFIETNHGAPTTRLHGLTLVGREK